MCMLLSHSLFHCLQGRDVTAEDVKDAILQLTVTEHYYTGVQDLVTLLCEFNGITVKVHINFEAH